MEKDLEAGVHTASTNHNPRKSICNHYLLCILISLMTITLLFAPQYLHNHCEAPRCNAAPLPLSSVQFQTSHPSPSPSPVHFQARLPPTSISTSTSEAKSPSAPFRHLYKFKTLDYPRPSFSHVGRLCGRARAQIAWYAVVSHDQVRFLLRKERGVLPHASALHNKRS